MLPRRGVRRARSAGARRMAHAALCLLIPALSLAGIPPRPLPRLGAHAAAPTTVDWPHFGNTSDQTRFSPLAQINGRTVRQLGLAWSLRQSARLQLWETDPVVVRGTMYLTTGTDEVLALDATTGAVRWAYAPPVDFSGLLTDGGGIPVNRGVEVAD